MKRILRGVSIVFFIIGFATISGVHAKAVASTHPMCWAGYCPDISKQDLVDKPARAKADRRGESTAPGPMGDVGY